MKRIMYLLLTGIFCCNFSYGQNWFPSSGPVGIGTTTPTSQLELFNIDLSRPNGVNALPVSILKLSRIGTVNYAYNESAEFRIGHGGPGLWGSRLDLFVNGLNNQSNIPDQHVMTWQYDGNVGIGSVNPNAKLDIFGNSTNATNLILSANYNSNFRWRFNTIDRGNAIDMDITASNNLDQPQTILKLSPTFSGRPSLILQDNWLVAKDGNISIGTLDAKGYKLAVAGNFISESVTVRVKEQWPDYVFKPAYKLASLSAVETFIEKNKHLPDMPSEADVTNNGLNLGEMNKLLLKKVEELTLHLIRQQKQIDQLNRIIKAKPRRII